MKNNVYFIAIALLLVGCSTDDSPNFYFDFLAAENIVDVPEAFTVNQTDTINVSYLRPTNCHGFDGFNVVTNDNEREITIITKVVQQDSGCPAITNDVRVASLVFKPAAAGEVILKFFNGNDPDGNPIFLTFNVPILE